MSLSDPKIIRLVNLVAPGFKSEARLLPPDLKNSVISFILCPRESRYTLGLRPGYPWTTLVMIIVEKFRCAAPFLVVPTADLHEWAEYAAWQFVLSESKFDHLSSLFSREDFGVILGTGGDYLDQAQKCVTWKPAGGPEQWLKTHLRSVMEVSQSSLTPASTCTTPQTGRSTIQSTTPMSQTASPPAQPTTTPSPSQITIPPATPEASGYSPGQTVANIEAVQESPVQVIAGLCTPEPSPQAIVNMDSVQKSDIPVIGGLCTPCPSLQTIANIDSVQECDDSEIAEPCNPCSSRQTMAHINPVQETDIGVIDGSCSPSPSSQATANSDASQESDVQSIDGSCTPPSSVPDVGAIQENVIEESPTSSQESPEATETNCLDIDSLTFEVAQADAVSDRFLDGPDELDRPSPKRTRSETTEAEFDDDPWRKLSRIDASAVVVIKRRLEAEIDLRDAFLRNEYERKLFEAEEEHLQAELKSLQKRRQLNKERLKMNEREKELIQRVQALESTVPNDSD